MQATQPKRRAPKLSQERFDIVMQMQKRWPEAININEPKPLAIGVHRQIQQELDLTDDAIGSVMRWYVQRAAYCQALEAGAHRYALDGTIAAAVQDDERPSARARRQGKASASAPRPPRFSWQERHANKETLMADAELDPTPDTSSISADIKLVLRQTPRRCTVPLKISPLGRLPICRWGRRRYTWRCE